MNIVLTYHIMPWEIDYALLTFTQLKRSKYYLESDIKIKIKSALNLSDYLINWKESKLPKEYFIEKYKTLSLLLKDYEHTDFIYDGSELWGHLDFQRSAIEDAADHYIAVCSDIYFSEHLLAYITAAAKSIKNKYFLVTPQICRMWDASWDVLVHPNFAVGPYYGWEHTTDIFDVDCFLHNSSEEIKAIPINNLKWAGWFDLYNKNLYEDLIRIPEEWKGYGAWDFYGMMVCDYAKHIGYDFQEYRLDGQVAFEYSIGPLRSDKISGFSNYYKSFLSRKDVSEQRENFNKSINFYITKKMRELSGLS